MEDVITLGVSTGNKYIQSLLFRKWVFKTHKKAIRLLFMLYFVLILERMSIFMANKENF